jgi:hypothetical protein
MTEYAEKQREEHNARTILMVLNAFDRDLTYEDAVCLLNGEEVEHKGSVISLDLNSKGYRSMLI